MQIVGVVDVLEVQNNVAVGFRACREVVFVEGGVEGVWVLDTLVQVDWGVFALSVDFEHQIFIPFVIRED
jgi:hypothetical protein